MKKWLAMTSLSKEMTSSLYSCYEQPLPMCVYVRERGGGREGGRELEREKGTGIE